jgi:hypothetical protein
MPLFVNVYFILPLKPLFVNVFLDFFALILFFLE